MKKLVLISLLLSSSAVSAALNKWVDADGQVHYSDLPPPTNIKTKSLRSSSSSTSDDSIDSSATNAPDSAPKTIAEREVELKKAQQEKKAAVDKVAKEQADAEARKNYCTSAQRNLQLLQEGVRMMEIDASGEQSYMEDGRRQQEISRIQQDIAKNCK